jgi:hypothetical protein
MGMSHYQLLLTAPVGSAKSPGHLQGGADPPHSSPGSLVLGGGGGTSLQLSSALQPPEREVGMGVQSDEGDRCGPDVDSWGWH